MVSRPEGPSDSEVITASLSEPERFGQIFERHFDAIHGYAARRVGTPLADDLAAQTFTIAFERRQSFDVTSDTARPWLYGIATNLIRNHNRAERRLLNALARLRGRATTGGGEDIGLHIEGVAEQARLAATLGKLRPEQREVLLLHCWTELTQAEIAAALELSPGTVASRLSRARRHVRTSLGSPPSGDSESTFPASSKEKR